MNQKLATSPCQNCGLGVMFDATDFKLGQTGYYPETYTGQLQVKDSDFVENFVVYHFPDASSLLSGQELPDCLCMRVGNYNSGGNSVIALDCGKDR